MVQRLEKAVGRNTAFGKTMNVNTLGHFGAIESENRQAKKYKVGIVRGSNIF